MRSAGKLPDRARGRRRPRSAGEETNRARRRGRLRAGSAVGCRGSDRRRAVRLLTAHHRPRPSCSISSPPTGRVRRHADDHDQEKSTRFFIVLVLVVVLDCFPRPAERGRRRPRARSGKIHRLLFRSSSSSSCPIAFLGGRIEDDDEHEGD